MKYLQAIVSINGVLHVHSQLFKSKESGAKEIAKNEAYKLVGWHEITIEPLESE